MNTKSVFFKKPHLTINGILLDKAQIHLFYENSSAVKKEETAVQNNQKKQIQTHYDNFTINPLFTVKFQNSHLLLKKQNEELLSHKLHGSLTLNLNKKALHPDLYLTAAKQEHPTHIKGHIEKTTLSLTMKSEEFDRDFINKFAQKPFFIPNNFKSNGSFSITSKDFKKFDLIWNTKVENLALDHWRVAPHPIWGITFSIRRYAHIPS